MQILVTGATGTVGRQLVDQLAPDRAGPDPAALELRAGSRGGQPVGPASGARLDFDDPTTWDAALAGVDRLFLVRPPSMSRVAPLQQFADAAVARGVGRIVFLSLLGAEKNRVVPHRRVEEHLEGLAAETSFLRASFFMQNLLGPHRPDIVQLQELIIPAGRGRTSFVDTRDVAAVAAVALTNPDAARAYDLTGPEALSYHHVAAILSDVLGRAIRYREPSLLRFGRIMRDRGHPWPFILVMAAIYTTARLGLADRVTTDVEDTLGRPATTLRRFLQDHADQLLPLDG